MTGLLIFLALAYVFCGALCLDFSADWNDSGKKVFPLLFPFHALLRVLVRKIEAAKEDGSLARLGQKIDRDIDDVFAAVGMLCMLPFRILYALLPKRKGDE